MKSTYRQGDVMLKRVNKLPEGLNKKDNIIAYGEVTGHKHQIINGQVLVDKNGKQFVEATGETVLVHEEHHDHAIEEGIYEVKQQRELSLLRQTRQVMD